MKPFDFAETKILERNYFRRHSAAKLRWVAVLAATMIVVSMSSYALRVSSGRRVKRAKLELAQVESRCANVRREMAVQGKQLLETKWQDHLATSSRRVLTLLNTVTENTPEDVWLSGVGGLDKTPEITVVGSAASFQSLSDMVGALRREPALASVQLSNARSVGPNGAEPVEFSMKLEVKDSVAPPTAAAQGQTTTPAGVPQLGGGV